MCFLIIHGKIDARVFHLSAVKEKRHNKEDTQKLYIWNWNSLVHLEIRTI